MSIGSLLPIQFYEIAFVLTFVLLPIVAFRGDIENYVFGAGLLYLCTKIIRRRGNKPLPAEGRAVFISGCDSGFGNLAAVKLDSEGYKVFAACLNPEGDGAKKLKSECSDRLHVLELDVTSDVSVKNAGKVVRENLGECCLWSLVNNAGVYVHGDVELCQLDTYKQVMDVNCYGMVRLTQELLPLIRQSKGRVVIMTSIMALFTWPCGSAYSASKMAVKCIGDCLRMEMSKFGVKVCMIEPAMFGGNTDIHSEQNVLRYYKEIDSSWDSMSDDIKSTYPKTYMKDQIAAIVKFRHSLTAKTPDAVVDAMTEAVTGSNPKCRYTVHGGPFMVDPVALYATLHKFLPEFLSDWLLCKVTGHSDDRLLRPEAFLNGHVENKTE